MIVYNWWREELITVPRNFGSGRGGSVSDKTRSVNAFSEKYVAHLRDLDEPEGPWVRDVPEPLVIYEAGGLYGLFRPWQRPDAGDEPEATFASLEDARLCLAGRMALRRKRYYELQPVTGARPP